MAATTPGAARAATIAPQPAHPADGRRGAPLPLAAAVTTVWAALVSLLPVLVVGWLTLLAGGGGVSAGDVLRGGFAAWLLAHGVPVQVSGGTVTLIPLVLTAFTVWRVARAGVHTARATGVRRQRSVWPAISAALAIGAVYAVLGALAAAFASGAGMRVPVGRAALTLALFGTLAALCGVFAEGRWYPRLAARTPAVMRDGLRTGIVAALLVLAAGAAAAGGSLAIAARDASRLLGAYHAGLAGQAGLTVLCLIYAPNLAVWGASYLIGPGFAVGAGTTVSAVAVTVGPVPAVPVLAGLPSRPLSVWGGLLLAVPLAAGMVAGWLLARRQVRVAAGDGSWMSFVAAALLAGPVAGALLAGAAFVSSGALGGGRLAEMGAAAWPLAGIATAMVAVGALAAAAATKTLAGMRRTGGNNTSG